MNFNLSLNSEKLNLLNSLEKYTGINKESYLNDIINGEREWVDFEDLNECLEMEKSGNLKFHSNEEIGRMLGL